MSRSVSGPPAARKPMPTILELIRLATPYLAARGVPNPRLDAEVLLADELGLSRLDLYVQFDRPLVKSEVDEYRRRIVARGRRCPVAFITGKKEFFGLELMIRPGVLIPRPETETVVEEALRVAADRLSSRRRETAGGPPAEGPGEVPVAGEAGPGLKVADVGCGSGAIGLAIASRVSGSEVWAIDCSPVARELTQANARRLGLVDRVHVAPGDLLHTSTPLPLLDLVVSNPPYIPSAELTRLAPEIRDYEPRLALDGGPDGLAVYRRLLPEARQLLAGGGYAVVEIAPDRGEAVRRIGEAAGLSFLRITRDLAGHDRVAIFRKDEGEAP